MKTRMRNIIRSKWKNRMADMCYCKAAIIRHHTVKQNGRYLLSKTGHNNRYDFGIPNDCTLQSNLKIFISLRTLNNDKLNVVCLFTEIQEVIPIMMWVWYLQQEQLHGGGCESRQICREYLLSVHLIKRKGLTFLQINTRSRSYTLTMAIRLQISISINVTPEHFR